MLMVACCGLLVLDCFYCGLKCLLSACFYLLRWVGCVASCCSSYLFGGGAVWFALLVD